jgi:hypothetical protein
MDLQFETPRSGKSRYIFIAAIVLAVLLWPVLKHAATKATPGLTTEQSSGTPRAMQP